MQAARSLCGVDFPALNALKLTKRAIPPFPLHGHPVAATDKITAKVRDPPHSPNHQCTHESHALTAYLRWDQTVTSNLIRAQRAMIQRIVCRAYRRRRTRREKALVS